MDSRLDFDFVRTLHQERLRHAQRDHLIRAFVRARQEPPTPLSRLTGSAMTAVGGWLIATGHRLQAEPPAMAWSGVEEKYG